MGERIYLSRPGADETVGVATGFSWGALLLGFIWALSKRMWFAAFAMVAVDLLLCLPDLWFDDRGIVGLILSTLFGIVCGKYGNEWHRRTLERRGYVVL
ncbi:DUF2628 domain-containing protein [Paraburkholderia rhynchosiae]|uniref:DUF2628 domain-containing protein n=1 Tax=Paraburkholderia rhynchosiae TaxID=487049 RepID=A0A2N7WKF4_9BURK|nr:DUF2628 domain-containing protein [Paraburkholderia rhynchosiae]PMS29946.1 hypothetical protein C0Z16_15980 [Paraburkholderia rhynchosiae]CAB3695513.1 hypothetical protein LMG27174_03395 [Paraburkholderia rhynchosiae]